MKINGITITPENYSHIPAMLNALPPSIRKRSQPNAPEIVYNETSPQHQAYKTGMECFRRWETTRDEKDLIAAHSYLRESCRIQDNNPYYEVAKAERHHSYGYVSRLLGQLDTAISEFEKSTSIFIRHPNIVQRRTAMQDLCMAYAEAIWLAKQNEDTQKAETFRNNLKYVNRHVTDLSLSAQNGEPIDSTSHRIEQGEIGISRTAKMGTTNAHDCLCLVVSNPATGDMAVTHVDRSADASTLQQLFDRLSPDPSVPLQIKLVGAKYPEHSDHPAAKVANNNLIKVVNFLITKNIDVNIVAATIHDPQQPTSFVADPVTGELEEAIPGIENRDMHLASGRFAVNPGGAELSQNSGSTQLHMAIDLRRSNMRAPMLLQRGEVNVLRHELMGKEIEDLYVDLKTNSTISDREIPQSVECIRSIERDYNRSINFLIEKLDATIARLQSNSADPTSQLQIRQEDRQAIISAIENHPMHIGEHANLANQPLVDFIENQLFNIQGTSQSPNSTYTIDVAGLINVPFAAQPYEYIERAEQQRLQLLGEGPEEDAIPPPPPPSLGTTDDATLAVIDGLHPVGRGNPRTIHDITSGGTVPANAIGLVKGGSRGMGNERRLILHSHETVDGQVRDVYTVLTRRQAKAVGLHRYEREIDDYRKGNPIAHIQRNPMRVPRDSPALDKMLDKATKAFKSVFTKR